jgi:phage gp46-like protein
MTDIALVWDPLLARADIAVAKGDLVADAGLRTAVLISLFTDALARPDDDIPDGTDDRRGWWGDTPIEGEAADPIGSRLWLLVRAKRTEETRRRAEAYARDALAWMVADGVAAAVDASAIWAGDRGDQLRLTVVVERRVAGRTAREEFTLQWNAEATR